MYFESYFSNGAWSTVHFIFVEGSVTVIEEQTRAEAAETFRGTSIFSLCRDLLQMIYIINIFVKDVTFSIVNT